MTASSAPSERTRVRRNAENAIDDSATLRAIIDDAHLDHVAFHDDEGTHCIPTVCWREGEHLYIHGSNGGRLIKLLAQGAQACVTITHLDVLVMARAAFNHSMNYRSVLPLSRQRAAPLPDAGCTVAEPAYVKAWRG